MNADGHSFFVRENHRQCASVKEKQTLKNTIVLESQFGLVLNWAFIAQSGRRTLVIIVMDILVKGPWCASAFAGLCLPGAGCRVPVCVLGFQRY